MNKTTVILAIIAILAMSVPALADQPSFGSERLRQVNYMGYEITEHRWDGSYGSEPYIVKIYSYGSRLLGWQVTSNNSVVSQRSFVSEPSELPVCSGESVTYDYYKGYQIKHHYWECQYKGEKYTVNIYSRGSLLLGWQIFKERQIVSQRSFL